MEDILHILITVVYEIIKIDSVNRLPISNLRKKNNLLAPFVIIKYYRQNKKIIKNSAKMP